MEATMEVVSKERIATIRFSDAEIKNIGTALYKVRVSQETSVHGSIEFSPDESAFLGALQGEFDRTTKIIEQQAEVRNPFFSSEPIRITKDLTFNGKSLTSGFNLFRKIVAANDNIITGNTIGLSENEANSIESCQNTFEEALR